ncbi:MAG: DUF1254 domain-containing protein [Mesorhizobium sp.]
MLRLLYAIIVGLVGAGVVHIAILLLLPSYAERDAWTLISEAGPEYALVQVNRSQQAASVLVDADPLFEVGACRFDLSQGAVRLSSPERVPFWSISLFDRRGLNIYSLNDRTASDGVLDIIIATPVQLIEMRNSATDAFAGSVIVEADATETIAIIRSFVPDKSWGPIVQANLAATRCELAQDQQ